MRNDSGHHRTKSLTIMLSFVWPIRISTSDRSVLSAFYLIGGSYKARRPKARLICKAIEYVVLVLQRIAST